jgi:hypothetical protein
MVRRSVARYDLVVIYISGMEAGSGAGTAASEKAGWLPRPLRSNAGRSQNPLPALLSLALSPPAQPEATAARRRPSLGADGRPLPPDGSQPPPRPQAGANSTAPAPPPRQAAANPPLGADGRPLPPVGAPPLRPRTAPRRSRQQVAASVAVITRVPGSRLPPGQGPAAPAGHAYSARPTPAPAGEFLFDVRCSCGGSRRAPVTLADLRRMAERGLPASDAIAVATQDALDAIHRGIP